MIKRRKPIPRRSKKRKYSKPPNGLTFPGALDPRSRRYPDGREELRGKDKSNRRAEIFERAAGMCEKSFGSIGLNSEGQVFYGRIITLCPNRAAEWSHQPCIHIGVGNGHGRGFKCDAMSCGIASCAECHRKAHQ